MNSIKLVKRQALVEEKGSPLEPRRLVNQLGKGTSLPSLHRKSRQRDRRYARDVVGQSVVEWFLNDMHRFQDRRKKGKQKNRFRGQSGSPNSKHHSNNRPTHGDSVSCILPTRRSATTTTKTTRSSFPTRITTDDLTFQKPQLRKDSQSLVNIPQTFSIASVVEDKQCSSQVTMTYQSDTIFSLDLHHKKRDEVTVYQEANNGDTFVIFKGFLRAGDNFSFKSQRSIRDPFRLIICVNDLVDSCLSACCEFKYQDGVRIGGEDGLFWLQNIDGARPCAQCLEDFNASFRPHSSTSRRSASAMSKTSNRLGLPTINTNQLKFETKSNGANESRTFTTQRSQSDAAEFRPASTISHTSVSLPINNRSSSLSLTSTNFQWSTQRSGSVVGLTKRSSGSETTLRKEAVKDDESSTSSSQVQTTIAQFPISCKFAATPSSEPSTLMQPRMIGDVENFVIAWMGQNEENEIILLRGVINFIRVFEDIDALNKCLTECAHCKVIIILSYDRAHSVIHQIHSITCIYSIYLVSIDEYQNSDWTKDYHKVVGIYRSIESIRDHLRQTLPPISSTTFIPVITTDDNPTAESPFTYYQLLKETMLCDDEEGDLKKDLIEFCRLHYADNPDEMNNIDEFEAEFIPQKAIWWYTRHCFISKILTRALRTQEVDLLFKMRFIMQCLHTELKSIVLNEITTVYVSMEIPFDDALNLQKNINGLLLYSAYLPAMLQKPASVNSTNDNQQISVIFSINLGSGYGAKVKHLCTPGSNIDILIDIDTIFRIHSVEKVTERQWTINLESVTPTDPYFQQLTGSLRSAIEAPVVLLQLTKLLLAMKRYAECDYLAELVFNDQSLRGDPTLLASLAAVHHLLGNTDDEQNDTAAARRQFFKSLRAFQTFLPPDHPLMSASYNNIGSMYFKEDDYDEAIKFHNQALECQLKSTNPDTDAIATYSNNIGAVYFEQGKYPEALKHLNRAATILEKLSSTSKVINLCIIYQKIAASYWRMDKAKEALEYYQRTLDLQLASLSPKAHQISVTYFNLSTAYTRLGQIDEAVASAEKSVEQLLKIHPPDHPEVKENQAQLEIVRQKQWLQQVLSN